MSSLEVCLMKDPLIITTTQNKWYLHDIINNYDINYNIIINKMTTRL